MIKVLIVDDEKLVRQGLIVTMPWKSFDMEVVGEASNGIKALEFLQKNEVDLVMIDLAMPEMSGMELIRHVCENYPEIWMVVLTCYQDFNYIQEAMRYGVIDYILKTHLETEEMSEVLSRILKRTRHDELMNPVSRSALTVGREKRREGMLFLSLCGQIKPDELYAMGFFTKESLLELDEGVWFLPWYDENRSGEKIDGYFLYTEKWVLVKINYFGGTDQGVLHQMLLDYLTVDLFYAYEPGRNIYSISADEITGYRTVTGRKDAMERLKDCFFSLSCIYNEKKYGEMLKQIEEARPHKKVIKNILYFAKNEWLQSFQSHKLELCFKRIECLHFWVQWKQGLAEIREIILLHFHGCRYSEDIIESILKAVDFVKNNINVSLNQDIVAGKVNLSRSYFSICFRDIMGKPFNEFLREAKIEKAKVLLVNTADPMDRIASKAGFMDKKYFRQIFKEHTGLLPEDYKNKMT